MWLVDSLWKLRTPVSVVCCFTAASNEKLHSLEKNCVSRNLNAPATSLCMFHYMKHNFRCLFLTDVVQPGGDNIKASICFIRKTRRLDDGPQNRHQHLVANGMGRLLTCLQFEFAFQQQILAFNFHPCGYGFHVRYKWDTRDWLCPSLEPL